MSTTTRREQRPVLDLPRSPSERAAEILAVLGILFSAFVLLQAWSDLPDRVPRHFGVSGEPDAWGSKWWLVGPLITMWFLYGLLTIINRYPHIFNYPVRITEENAARQYRLARSLLSWLKAELVWVFTYIIWAGIRVAQGKAMGLGIVFLPLFLLTIFGTLGIYFWRSATAR